jgi:peptidyl-tRNA hydrolase, PTH1 family
MSDVTAPVLIVGLGNPGREYRETRHNAGFMLVDRLALRWGAMWRKESKFFAEVASATVAGKRVWLAKPDTFMNLSGESVGPLSRFHRIPPAQILVAVDDADLPLGTLRMRPGGGSGGHHGIESVTQHVGDREFPRLRIGIARPDQAVRDIAGHVLSRFGDDERAVLDKVLDRATQQMECWLSDGPAKAMSLYNGSVQSTGPRRKE